MQIRGLEESKRAIKGKSELMAQENDVYMSSETVFLQDQVEKAEKLLGSLVIEQKQLKHEQDHLTHQIHLVEVKVHELEEETAVMERQGTSLLVQMSDLNRQAMAELTKWQHSVEGPSPDSYLSQMHSKIERCFKQINELGEEFLSPAEQ